MCDLLCKSHIMHICVQLQAFYAIKKSNISSFRNLLGNNSLFLQKYFNQTEYGVFCKTNRPIHSGQSRRQ